MEASQSIIDSLTRYETSGKETIRALTHVTLDLASAKEDVERTKAAAIEEGQVAGALEGSNADTRKLAMTTWLANHAAYQAAVTLEASLDAQKTRLAGEVEAIKFGASCVKAIAELLATQE